MDFHILSMKEKLYLFYFGTGHKLGSVCFFELSIIITHIYVMFPYLI